MPSVGPFGGFETFWKSSDALEDGCGLVPCVSLAPPRAGHGFGMEGHERPYTSEGSPEIYQPNMLISVEPGLYVDGIGGFRQCDTVLITENGTENFTLGTPKAREQMTF